MKKTVFISSTYLDLKEYRSEVWELLNSNYDVEIKGMEDFGARTESPLETCLTEVDQSDIYVGLIGVRLGSINEEKGKSYTQLEYERALDKGKEILIYLIDEENAKVTPEHVDKKSNYDKLELFKEKLRKSHTVDFFSDENDLRDKLDRKFEELLETQEEESDTEDEIKFAEEVIDEFFIFPKSRYGKEVKLRLKFLPIYYPASKEICNSFNKRYGSTCITRINVKAPENGNEFDKILVDHSQFQELKNNLDNDVDIYANLLFTENSIEKFRAYFVREEQKNLLFHDIDPLNMGNIENQIAAQNTNPFVEEETIIHEAEGTVLLSLNEII